MNFVANQNIKRFRRLLEKETDSEKRAILKDLLAKEEATLAESQATRSGIEREDQSSSPK